MRRKEKEIKDLSVMEEIIHNSRVCRLGMVDGNKPYVIPLSFGYQSPCLYFHCAPEGRKIDLIQKNANVCFEFDRLIRLKKNKAACEWGAQYQSVIGDGKAVLVTDAQEKQQGLKQIMAQYSKRSFEFSDENIEKTIVIQVKIENITGKTSDPVVSG